jgi:chemotaxis family two-component system sensor kinase Cph1
MAYAGKLFGVFQRLHHERDFEGLGVGLASAQRIVERHGGTIRVEAAVERGAAVTFSLPAA